MLIQSQEVGTLSAAPPKFGKVGEWPPVATNYLPLRWELFDVESSDKAACGAYMTAALAKESSKFTDEYAASLERQVGVLDSPVDVVARLGNRSSAHIGDMNLELRRLVYAARWVRRDPREPTTSWLNA